MMASFETTINRMLCEFSFLIRFLFLHAMRIVWQLVLVHYLTKQNRQSIAENYIDENYGFKFKLKNSDAIHRLWHTEDIELTFY
jgi:hypothetical protein